MYKLVLELIMTSYLSKMIINVLNHVTVMYMSNKILKINVLNINHVNNILISKEDPYKDIVNQAVYIMVN